MAVDPQQVAWLSNLFDSTLSNDAATRTAATNELRAFENRPGSSIVTLTLVASNNHSITTRQAAAIAFKNLIMAAWDEDINADSRLSVSDRSAIKTHLLELMLTAPPVIQAQLTQVLAIISKCDFPDNWQQLLPDMITKLSQSISQPAANEHQITVGCLETLHSIFFRYRHEMRSDLLFKELKYVLDLFADPLTKIFTHTFQQLQQPANQSNKQLITEILTRLNLELNIFLSLNTQDIPEYFEMHMTEWFVPFSTLLGYSNPLVDPRDDSEPGLIDSCQALIAEILDLYASKYEEELNPHAPQFVQLIWQRLTALTTQGRYDTLATTAIKFLTSIVSKPFNKHMFEQAGALQAIVTQIVVPQIHLRESDIEMFEMDPTEWTRRDIEGSDVDTRRRVTIDLLRALTETFGTTVITLVQGYVNELLTSYAQNPVKSWAAKDAAIFILLALCSKTSTRAAGITKVNEAIDVGTFFTQQILPELNDADINSRPILKADCLKFIASLRSQLGADQLIGLLPLILKFLRSDSVVVHTYAAYSVEKLLTVRDNGVPRITKAALAPFNQSLLESLFSIFDHDSSEQNEYVMRAILRVIQMSGESMRPFTQPIIEKLMKVLQQVVANPSHPHFNHCLFDAIGALIASTCTASVQVSAAQSLESLTYFEQALFPVFEQVLGSEHGLDFSTYCFQLLAQLLEHRGTVTPQFAAIFPSLVTPVFYEQNATIPAAIRFIRAYLRAKYIESQPAQLPPILGIFQKLLSLRRQQVLGMQLMQSIFALVPLSILQPYLSQIWGMIFAKCQSAPGPVFLGAAVVTFCVFSMKHGGDTLINSFESVQAGIAAPLIERVLLANVQAVPSIGERRYERNIAIVGLSELAFKSPVFVAHPQLKTLWPLLITEIIRLADSSVATSAEDIEPNFEEEFVSGADTFSPLYHAVAPSNDWSRLVTPDARAALVSQLQQWNATHPGQLRGAITEGSAKLEPEQQQAIAKWCTQNNLAI